MKTEPTSAAAEAKGGGQAWTEPTLTTLAVSMETLASVNIGFDGGGSLLTQNS